jgi:hypothetical protein
MNEFQRDDAWQRGMRDRILVPCYYQRHFRGYVLADVGERAKFLQMLGVDTIAEQHDGTLRFIDEKIVRWPESGRPYTAFCMETESCTKLGFEPPGLMNKPQTEIPHLLYCFSDETETALDCYSIPFAPLREFFFQHIGQFPTFGPLKTINASAGRIVQIERVLDSIRGCEHFLFAAQTRMQTVLMDGIRVHPDFLSPGR